ncbi:MAG: leucyl aminopeptidase [Candidatus Binatia bacterium]
MIPLEVKFKDQSPERIKTDLLTIGVKQDGLKEPVIRLLDRHLKGRLSERIKRSRFTGAEGTALLHPTEGKLPASQVLLVGMGKEREIETDSWRRSAARARKEASGIWAEDVAFLLPPDGDPAQAVQAIVEGSLLASYQFNKYRSDNKGSYVLRSINLVKPGLRRSAAADRAVRVAQELTPAVFLARDLINEPPSISTASYLAQQAVRYCRNQRVKVEIWARKKIIAMKLEGLLAVNRGSQEEPRFIIIRYHPVGKPRKKVALIGKGITFDSGGLSLKTAKSMETMKLDMAGAAAIIGTMSVLPSLRPQIEVTGYIPTTDNLPSGSAQKPGDIIRYLNGKTVEILNTDAEGRLILADALALATREKPDCMVNLATLTGACMVALGPEVAGIFGNDQPLVDSLIRCGREAGEKIWQLPLVKEYREEIKSRVADIKNVGGSYGGAITAALFLQEFVADVPWAHLDIAGPAFAEKDLLTCPKGGTGFGVLTLLKFLSTL